jgi:hypothetical protein
MGASGFKYDDQPFDNSRRRSVEVVALPSELDPDRPRGPLVIEQFYHAGEFWRGVVPLGRVAEIRGQAFNFSKPKTRPGPDGPEIVRDAQGIPLRTLRTLNHVQCRFRLQPGSAIDLYPAGKEPTGEPVHRVSDFVYSLEAVGPVGVGFNFWDAVGGHLICAHRFVSTQEMVFERIVIENQYVVESPPLLLDDDEKQRILLMALQRSDRARMRERYYLYRCCGTNNCTSNAFQILDRCASYPWWGRLGAMLYRFPLYPRFYLRVRGLDADPNTRRLVRDEFAEYVEHPQTQQRKRVVVREQVKAARQARKNASL